MTTKNTMAVTVSHLDADGHETDRLYNIPFTGKLLCTYDHKSPHPEEQKPAVETRFMIFADETKGYQLLTVSQEGKHRNMSYQYAPDQPMLQELLVAHGCNNQALMDMNGLHPFKFMAQDIWINRNVTFALNQMMGKPIDLKRSRVPALLQPWNPFKYKP